MYVKFFFLLLSAAVSCHAHWYDDIYNALASPTPPVPSGAAIAGAMGIFSLSYLLGKSNGQGDIIDQQNELTQMTKERDKEKTKADALKTEVGLYESREVLINISNSNADPQLKKAAEAMVGIDQSIKKYAKEARSLNEEIYRNTERMAEHFHRNQANLRSEIEKNTSVIATLVQGVFLIAKLETIHDLARRTLSATRQNNELLKESSGYIKNFQSGLTRHENQIVSRIKNILPNFMHDAPPRYTP